MEINTEALTPEQLELVRFGSLCSKKLRRLYFSALDHNTGDSSTGDVSATTTDESCRSPISISNGTKLDCKLNLDLKNYLKTAPYNLSDTNSQHVGESLDHKSPVTTIGVSRSNTSPSLSKPLEYKRPNDKSEIEKEWASISEAEPTHTALREWKSIQLRGFVDPKKFYKNMKNKLEEIPKQFQIGRIVDKKAAVDLNKLDSSTNSTSSRSTNQFSKKKRTRKGPSLITSMLKEDKGWVSKRYNEIQSEKTKGSKGWYQRQLKKRKRG